MIAVIPGYFLVWYDEEEGQTVTKYAVIPGYFLVWYDREVKNRRKARLCGGFWK